jgi:hypothetical protein
MIESHELRILFVLGLGAVAIVAIATGAAVGSLLRWIGVAVVPSLAVRARAFLGGRRHGGGRPASRQAPPTGEEVARPLRGREAA